MRDQIRTKISGFQRRACNCIVVAHALGRAGEDGKVIRLAWMAHTVSVREERPLHGKGVDEWRTGIAYNLPIGMILFHHNHHVRRFPWGCAGM